MIVQILYSLIVFFGIILCIIIGADIVARILVDIMYPDEYWDTLEKKSRKDFR